MERNSLENLKLFIQRCIQAIDLLELITFNHDERLFSKITKSLSVSDRDRLASIRFIDLVNVENNGLIRTLLELALSEGNNDEDSH